MRRWIEERLVGLHHREVVVGVDVEEAEDLVEQLAVLPGDANPAGEVVERAVIALMTGASLSASGACRRWRELSVAWKDYMNTDEHG
jgi:hypothetical protein